MSLFQFAFTLSIFWTVIHILHYYLRSNTRGTLLPTTRADHGRSRITAKQRWGRIPFTTSLRYVHLKVESSVFNVPHAHLSAFLSRKGARLAYCTRVFYDTGSFVCSLGMIASFGLLLWTAGQVSWSCSQMLVSSQPSPAVQMSKRSAVEPGELNAHASEPSLIINPIIPGITVPLWHLPILIGSLFVSQVIHEAGHAICASLEGLSLRGVGLTFTLIFPSAFTALSPFDVSTGPLSRIRILAAGAWHNFSLYLILYSCMNYLHLGPVIWNFLGYEDVQQYARVVLSVEENSPLAFHVPPGALIVALDDTRLSSLIPNGMTQDLWTTILLGKSTDTDTAEQGWCIDSAWFLDQPSICCSPDYDREYALPPAAQLSCFTPLLDFTGASDHCIDPFTMLVSNESSSTRTRCSSSESCSQMSSHVAGFDENELKESRVEQLCVKPHAKAQLLRITELLPHEISADEDNEPRVVLWSGPRREVWEQVEVGRYRPLSPHLPLWLPTITTLFFSYLATLSLSLFFFNLLCLPHLDGSQLLSAVIDLISGVVDPPGSLINSVFGGGIEGFAFNLEEGNGRQQTHPTTELSLRASFGSGRAGVMRIGSDIARRKRHIERVAMIATGSSAAVVAVGSLFLNASRSYLLGR